MKTLVGKNNYLFLINDTCKELEVHCNNLTLITDSQLNRYNPVIDKFLLVVFPDKSLIHKDFLDEIKYFDERFLGFGTEDSDFTWRYITTFKKAIPTIWSGGIKNINSDLKHDNIKVYGKYTEFNRDFCFNSKYLRDDNNPNAISANFANKVIQVLKDENQYPYEKFFKENKDKL